MDGLMRFPKAPVAGPRLGGSPPITSSSQTGYPWVDGELLYAADLNAAFADTGLASNVLYYGADPTGVADSTAAFNAAIATGKRVYVPGGTYKITGAITINAGQIIYGDGPRASKLQITSAFNMSALGVLVPTTSTKEADVEIRDLWIQFIQPDFAGMTRADIIHYPPGINATNSNRNKFINLQISNAWVGINEGGAGFWDRIEISAYSAGFHLGVDGPVLDVQHISNYHFWNFDMSANQSAVAWDGVTVGAQMGRIDGLVASDWLVFRGRVNITDTAGISGFYYMSNMVFDSTTAQLNIANTYVFEGVNLHFTRGATETTPQIVISGGRNSFTNVAMQSSMVTTPMVQITGGGTIFNGGTPWWKEAGGAECVSLTGGNCTLNGVVFGSHTGVHTAPFVHQSGTAFLAMNHCQFPPSGVTGTAVQMDTVVTGSHVGPNNTFGALTFSGAGFNTAAAVSTPGQITAGGTSGGLITCGLPTSANSTYRLSSVIGSDHIISAFSGGALRWNLIMGTGAETGGNAGCDTMIQRFDDTGAFIDSPVTITRVDGKVFAHNLAASAFGLNIATPIGRQTVTGAKGGNAALASLLSALAAFGLITDSTTA